MSPEHGLAVPEEAPLGPPPDGIGPEEAAFKVAPVALTLGALVRLKVIEPGGGVTGARARRP